MQPAAASPAVVIGYEIAVAADLLAQDKHMRPPHSDHSRPRLCTGKLEPVTGQPEITDGLAEDLYSRPASAEVSTRASYRVGKILRLVRSASTSAAMNMTGHGLALKSLPALEMCLRKGVMLSLSCVCKQAKNCHCRERGFEHRTSLCYC